MNPFKAMQPLSMGRTTPTMRSSALLWAFLLATLNLFGAERLTEHLTYWNGPVNSVLLEQAGARIAIYGIPPDPGTPVEQLLVTHHRRDILGPARKAAEHGVSIAAPGAERPLIDKPGEYWDRFITGRFHDYDQQTTRVLTAALPVSRWVTGGDMLPWRGYEFQVLDTPGYTRGSVSYVVRVDDRTIAFTGDLIVGDGKILDLYSFQDAIPEAGIRGYHGYGGRLAALVASLEKIRDAKPDLIVPSRGDVIRDPGAAIERLIQRVRALYKNYLSTNALHWYFKEDRMRSSGERVLGKGADIELMPYAQHREAPDWVFEHATSRLLISDDGTGFLLDCGYQRVIDAVKKLMTMGVVEKVEGIFVTHFHDDHADMVEAAAREFNCPVYALEEYADVLENPAAYHLPAMTSNPISNIRVKKNGDKMRWHEFEFTFNFYPGQAYYHGALLAQRNQERPVFFIGDSFAPSGIDDYCVLNRNLVREDSGYFLCFEKLRQLGSEIWLVNEHIPYVFAFSNDELNHLETRYRQRVEILRDLFPWDNPNYGIDEQWAVFYPYGNETAPGRELDLEVRIANHSPRARTFNVTPHLPNGTELLHRPAPITLGAGASGRVRLRVKTPATPGTHLITADVDSDGMEFRDWIEALVIVK
jgi:glyoxylase-like metal-dependent hydrolase (beta-lactamase superfamily II)